MSVFSFHAIKHVVTGEGGMVTTDRADFAEKLRSFRNHGIATDARRRQLAGQWQYDMNVLGFNYRLTDIAAALGLAQLKKLGANLTRRREIATRYFAAFRDLKGIILPSVRDDVKPAWHLYPIRVNATKLNADRGDLLGALLGENIGTNVHYIPVHLHSYYRKRFGHQRGEYPVAERAYDELLSLPMFHGMDDEDVDDVVTAVKKVTRHYSLNRGFRER